MLSIKPLFSSQILLLMLLGTATVLPALAESAGDDASLDKMIADDDQLTGLQQTLEYNFSPEDRARLRKALADYSRNNDPEHIQIESKRKAMKASLKERFNRCNNDLDDSLDRQEVTECLPQVARHFNTVDVDEDNVITVEELELAQAKWIERHKAADAKVEAQRIKEAEAKIKKKRKSKGSKQAASKSKRPS